MADNTNKPKGSFAKLMSAQTTPPEPNNERVVLSQKISSEIGSQSTDKSIDQSTDQSTDQYKNRFANSSSAIVDRPKAFYITERLDRKLDTAVRYFQEVHGIRKADRSTVINALLDEEAVWTNQSLDRLVDRLIGQLTSRLTSRSTSK